MTLPTLSIPRNSVPAVSSSSSITSLPLELVGRLAVFARGNDLRAMTLVSVQWNGACKERLVEIRHLVLNAFQSAPLDKRLEQQALECAPLLIHGLRGLTKDWYTRIAERGEQTVPGKWFLPLLLLHPQAAQSFIRRRVWEELTGVARVALIPCANDLNALRQQLLELSQRGQAHCDRPDTLLTKLLVGVFRFGYRELDVIKLAEEMLSPSEFLSFAQTLLNFKGHILKPEIWTALEEAQVKAMARARAEPQKKC